MKPDAGAVGVGADPAVENPWKGEGRAAGACFGAILVDDCDIGCSASLLGDEVLEPVANGEPRLPLPGENLIAFLKGSNNPG